MTSADNATYTYNAQGLRVSKSVGNATTNFLLVGGNVWSDGITNYTRGIELISNGTQLYLYNVRGDVIQLLGFDGEVDKTYDYDAYGNEYARDLGDENPFRYCGEYYDTETGFIYLRARYYDPMVGRFTSVDPAKDGLNWYAYCEGNPVKYVDPSGESYEKNDSEQRDEKSEAIWKGLAIFGMVVALVGITALSIASFGATSGMAVLATAATVSYISQEAEIGILQAKKSISDGDDFKDVVEDVAISMYDNSVNSSAGIVKDTAVDYAFKYPVVDSFSAENGNGLVFSKKKLQSNYAATKDIKGNLSQPCSKIGLIYSYASMSFSVGKVFIAIDYDDYEYIAKERGYVLR